MAYVRRALLLLLILLQASWSPVQVGAGGRTSACSTCHGTCNEEIGRCDCLRGFSGADCSEPPKDLPRLCKTFIFKSTLNCTDEPDDQRSKTPCLNACNQRGRCYAGVCLCQPGFFGGDCSLSLDSNGKPELLAGLAYKPRAKRPHIYVYELPPKYNTWYNMRSFDRPLAFFMYQRLLGSGARVADGDEADYYFIPVNIRGPSDSARLQSAIRYISATWPWWGKYQGGRHFMFHVGDPGRGDVLPSVRTLTENCTYLHHFGLHQDYPFSGWKASHRPGQDIVVPLYLAASHGTANVFRRSPLHPLSPERGIHKTQRRALQYSSTAAWTHAGSSYSISQGSMQQGSSALHKGSTAGGSLHGSTGYDQGNTLREHGSTGSEHLAIGSEDGDTGDERAVGRLLHSSKNSVAEPHGKTLELLFAGRICGGGEQPDSTKWPNCPRNINTGYSQGVRQLVHFHHWNRTGYSIMNINKNYIADLERSRFCLAPTGGGYGHRQALVSFAGCVPLLIGDFVHQPFEPELDWSQFSVSLPQSDIPILHQKLAAVDSQQHASLVEALRCGAEHMTYSTFIGGFKWDTGRYDAFETILEILRARLEHPGVPPEQLAGVDPELAAFMQCRQPGQAQQQEPDVYPKDKLCSLSLFDGNPIPCTRCLNKHGGVVPGGTPCCESTSLADCPRMWD